MSDRKIMIGIISINRKEGNAYIWVTKENPYWSTNLDISLIALEYLLGLRFTEKYGKYWVQFSITEEDLEYLYALKN